MGMQADISGVNTAVVDISMRAIRFVYMVGMFAAG